MLKQLLNVRYSSARHRHCHRHHPFALPFSKEKPSGRGCVQFYFLVLESFRLCSIGTNPFNQNRFWLIWLKLPMKLDLRFEDEDDYEYEIFSIPSCARAWASVILAGKRDSCRHSATWYSKNRSWRREQVIKCEKFLSFFDRERA